MPDPSLGHGTDDINHTTIDLQYGVRPEPLRVPTQPLTTLQPARVVRPEPVKVPFYMRPSFWAGFIVSLLIVACVSLCARWLAKSAPAESPSTPVAECSEQPIHYFAYDSPPGMDQFGPNQQAVDDVAVHVKRHYQKMDQDPLYAAGTILTVNVDLTILTDEQEQELTAQAHKLAGDFVLDRNKWCDGIKLYKSMVSHFSLRTEDVAGYYSSGMTVDGTDRSVMPRLKLTHQTDVPGLVLVVHFKEELNYKNSEHRVVCDYQIIGTRATPKPKPTRTQPTPTLSPKPTLSPQPTPSRTQPPQVCPIGESGTPPYCTKVGTTAPQQPGSSPTPNPPAASPNDPGSHECWGNDGKPNTSPCPRRN